PLPHAFDVFHAIDSPEHFAQLSIVLRQLFAGLRVFATLCRFYIVSFSGNTLQALHRQEAASQNKKGLPLSRKP
ncbi:MAG: hypothetical protein K2N86_04505, partial [Rikenellaceae bacterium]|nr:hypothetical protein [Rikenellaceae bacterium]